MDGILMKELAQVIKGLEKGRSHTSLHPCRNLSPYTIDQTADQRCK